MTASPPLQACLPAFALFESYAPLRPWSQSLWPLLKLACAWHTKSTKSSVAEPEHFDSVGQFYDDFSQIENQEVIDLLAKHRKSIASRAA
jgi:hypothetical protein